MVKNKGKMKEGKKQSKPMKSGISYMSERQMKRKGTKKELNIKSPWKLIKSYKKKYKRPILVRLKDF